MNLFTRDKRAGDGRMYLWPYLVLFVALAGIWSIVDQILLPQLLGEGFLSPSGWAFFEWALLSLLGGGLIAICMSTGRRWGEQHHTLLSESEERLQALVNLAADGVVAIDERGSVLSFNRAAETLFGYKASEVVGRNVSLLMPQPYKADHDAYIRSYVETGRAQIIGRGREVQGVRKDGRIFPLYLSVSEARAGGRRIFFGMVHDLSELKRGELALAEKTRDLERSNAELEQFAYVASHDLQEPLRMVASYVQLLSKRYSGKLDRDADEFIQYAVDGARRMQNLINDLLTYSRVGRRDRAFEAVNLKQAAEYAVKNLSVACEESGARVEIGELPEIYGEANAMIQLFQNLIGNAIKFRRPNVPPLIRIRAEPEGAFYRVEIEDNGIGINPRYFDRIFVVFQRLNERDQYQGNGIGLAICKKIVELHGGAIGLRSDGQSGATFYFTLPASPAKNQV